MTESELLSAINVDLKTRLKSITSSASIKSSIKASCTTPIHPPRERTRAPASSFVRSISLRNSI